MVKLKLNNFSLLRFSENKKVTAHAYNSPELQKIMRQAKRELKNEEVDKVSSETHRLSSRGE